ncbi:MAG: CoA transferase [Burkholderiales bacterium]|nr:CoA transferase [Burkholderiales bacterium]
MDNETRRKQHLPLEGVRVLELSHIVAGPSGGMMLADLGADVIKIEHPDGGDTSRGSGNNGATFFTYNRNKKFLALDLRRAKGKAVFERLVRGADVVFHNFSPGALDRLGLGYEWARAVNARIIYCAVKGFLPGPFGDRPYLDELAQMAGGLAYLTGLKDLPLRAGASVTDIGAATYGALAVVAALFRRHSTGIGESIEAGLYETVVFWVGQAITTTQMTGKDAMPRGERTSSGMDDKMGWGVYRLFPTRDGSQVFIAVTGNRHWTALCELLGFDDWKDSPEFNTNRKRSAQKGRLAERIKAAVLEYDFADITRKLGEHRIPYAPVNTPMTLLSEQHLNEARRWLGLDVAGHKLKVPKLPIAMSQTQEFEVRDPPGTIGNHTDSILAEAGYSAAEIEALKAEKVVAATARMLTDLPGES